jgi:hypothetical protein
MSASRVKPLKLTEAAQAMHRLRTVLADLRAVGVPRLSDVRRDHLVTVLDQWKTGSVETAACLITALKQLSAHGPFLSWDRLTIHPWPGRSAAAVAGRPPRSKENSTDRIPEHIMSPYLRGAVFYVTTASKDILAGQRVLEDLRAAAERKPYAYGRGRAMFASLAAVRGTAGRGLPALPLEMAHLRPDAPVVDGIVQAPNVTFIELLIGGYGADPGLRRTIDEAGEELGYEPGGLDSHISPWPESGLPWRPRLDPFSVKTELQYLRTACWAVIAYLSGMRDPEVRELSRDCAFTEPGDDGRLRYKIRGRVYKHGKLSGDEAEWVVLEIVHQAIEVLRAINNCPQYLFGWGPRETGFAASGTTSTISSAPTRGCSSPTTPARSNSMTTRTPMPPTERKTPTQRRMQRRTARVCRGPSPRSSSEGLWPGTSRISPSASSPEPGSTNMPELSCLRGMSGHRSPGSPRRSPATKRPPGWTTSKTSTGTGTTAAPPPAGPLGGSRRSSSGSAASSGICPVWSRRPPG